MDINLIRAAVTLAALAAFAGIVWWAYSPSRRTYWEHRALLDGEEE